MTITRAMFDVLREITAGRRDGTSVRRYDFNGRGNSSADALVARGLVEASGPRRDLRATLSATARGLSLVQRERERETARSD